MRSTVSPTPSPSTPAPRSEEGDYAPLPRPLTLFVVRDGERAELGDLLRDSSVRLLTLTGPGGVGKTRLALRLAEDAAAAFPDGVAFVDLALIADPALVLPALARSLGVTDAGDRPLSARLTDALGERRLLMVLDNVEQVVAAGPDLAQLLRACPGLTLLATSRIPLRVAGEQEAPVRPLAVPDANDQTSLHDLARTNAVALFLARARAVKSDFALTAANAAAVAELCRHLDGLPLAIELAAARSKVLAPDAMLTRPEHRLVLLAGGPRDAPPRLRTMRDAVAWSHDLLTPEDQTLLRRLAVFAGGFTLEAAAAVVGAPTPDDLGVLDGVARLVDASLLQAVDTPEGMHRFAMLETVRAFGIERLAAGSESVTTRDAHAAWCLDLAARAQPALRRQQPGYAEWLGRLEVEHANLRAGLAWLEAAGATEPAVRLAGLLGPFWYYRGYLREGSERLTRVLALARPATAEEQPVASSILAPALTWDGLLRVYLGDLDGAVARLEAALPMWPEVGDPWGRGLALVMLVIAAERSGAFDRAADLLNETAAAFEAAGDAFGVALTRYHRGAVAYYRGEPARAAALLAEALDLFRRAADQWGVGVVLAAMGHVAQAQGDAAVAASAYAEHLALVQRLGLREATGGLVGAAALAATRGQPTRAARLLGAAAAFADATGSVPSPLDRAPIARAEREAAAALGDAAFARALAEGRGLSWEAAVAEAAATVDELSVPLTDPAPMSAPSRPAGISDREADVLRLVARGLTNAQIADQLYLSPRTVQAHLRTIYRKLEVANRSEAVRAALAHGLS